MSTSPKLGTRGDRLAILARYAIELGAGGAAEDTSGHVGLNSSVPVLASDTKCPALDPDLGGHSA